MTAGGDPLLLKLAGRNAGSVWYHDEGNHKKLADPPLYPVADSFTDFLYGLRPG